jgi:hypothetical protein
MSQNQKVVVIVQGGEKSQDYCARAQEMAEQTPVECDPLLATPELDALLALLAADGHNVDRFIDERDRVKNTLNVHLTIHRSLARQVASVESSHAAILAGR